MGQTNVKNLGNGGTMDGDVTITGDLTVSGGISLSLNEVLQGTSTIDINNTEALLVRKDGDGGDVFIVDTTNSRVGVGIAPSHELTVNNQIGIKRDGTNAFGTLTFDSSGLVLDQSASGYSPLKIKSNGSEVARFTSTGLGVGVTSNSASLHVKGGTANTARFQTASGATNILLSDSSDSLVGQIEFSASASQIVTRTSSRLSLGSNNVQTLHITDDDRVGIGEDSPDQLLHLKATNGSQVLLQRTSADTSSILGAVNFGASDGDEYLATIISQHDGATDSAYLAFQTEATGSAKAERMRITSGGNVGIGTSSPSAPLEIKGDAEEVLIVSRSTSTANSQPTTITSTALKSNGAYGAISYIKSEWNDNTHGSLDSNISFWTRDDNTIAERLTISESNVGIGEDSPDKELHLKGSEPTFRIEQTADANKYFDIQTGTGGGVGKLKFSSETNANTLVIGNNARVGINNGAPTETLHISSSEASATPVLLLENTNANNLAPQINLYKNSASPADGDYAGQIDFEGKDSAGNRTEYGRIITEQYRVLSGAEDGIMDLKVAVDGTLANGIRIRGGTGARVGIGSGATNPSEALEVNGSGANLKVVSDNNVYLSLDTTQTNGDEWHIFNANSGATSTLQLKNVDQSKVVMLLDETGKIGVNNTSPVATMDIVGDRTINLTNTTSDDTNKNAVITHSQYDSGTETEGFLLMQGFSNSSTNRIDIGGGNSQHNATEEIKFYTASNSTTATGTERMVIDNAGNVGIGTTDTSGNALTIAGDNVLLKTNNTFLKGVKSDATNEAYLIGIDGFNNVVVGDGTGLLKLDTNSRISLSNNDSGGTGGRDSTSSNTLFGWNAGTNIDAGSVVNTFIGHASGSGSLDDAQNNVGVGAETLQALTTGDSNVVVGSYGAFGLTTASRNIIIGTDAGFAITSGNENVAVGNRALGTANTATFNVAVGGDSMFSIPTGQAVTGVVAVGLEACKGSSSTTTGIDGTVAIGRASLKNITSGERNTAVGFESLKSNTIGDKNTAVGYQALESFNADTDGHGHNTAVGHNAMQGNVTGTDNTAIGHMSAFSGTNNMTAGDNNTFVGSLTSPSSATPTNQTVIGYNAVGQADNSVTLGNSSVTAVYMSEDSGAVVHTAGIQFPASQVANGGANVLDDYEEGTFTPTWVSGSGTLGSINYSNQVGKYTKIGNAVTITISFYNGSFDAGTGSGSLKITGLPFTSGAKSSLALGDTRLFGGDNPSEAEVTNSSTNVTLYFRSASNGANSELQVSDAGTGSGAFNLVTLSGTYFV